MNSWVLCVYFERPKSPLFPKPRERMAQSFPNIIFSYRNIFVCPPQWPSLIKNMAREGGIERISACKKQYISLTSPHWPWAVSSVCRRSWARWKDPLANTPACSQKCWCVSFVCVFVTLYVWVHVCISVFVCAHCATRHRSLVASASAFRNGILHAFAILSLFFLSNKWQTALIKTWISSELRSGSTVLQYIAYPRTVFWLAETNCLIHPLDGFLVCPNCLDWSGMMVL